MVKFKSVLVKRIPRRAEMDAAINKAMVKFSDLMGDEFESTTETFQNTNVVFVQEEKFTPDHKEVTVFTTNKIYKYLNNGTSVRYATMGPRFRNKTAPQQIKAMPGQTDVLFVNKKRPRPGIKRRSFDIFIRRKLEPKYFKFVSDAVQSFTEDF